MENYGGGGFGIVQVIGLIIAAAVGFWVYKDATTRGMNGILWGILTFLICIIFLPIYLIIRKPQTGANG